jgi:hypothetical protein
MGMYNDFRNFNRETWSFTYLAKQLLPHAERKKESYKTQETASRTEMAALLSDPNVRASDRRIEELKSEIETFADLYEKCVIWCWEFGRDPEKEFVLKIGDVSFFDIPEELRKAAQA